MGENQLAKGEFRSRVAAVVCAVLVITRVSGQSIHPQSWLKMPAANNSRGRQALMRSELRSFRPTFPRATSNFCQYAERYAYVH